jgi:REP-associated tyrosine transposase
MKLFKSNEANTFHYVTTVTFKRVPVFRSNHACQLFIEALAESRRHCDFKLIGYVVMPDHAHLILNPRTMTISEVIRRLKSSSARAILDWLRENKHVASIRKLTLDKPQSANHSHALWQKGFSSVDLWSPRFILQKLSYVHLNPVRAQLCDHPAKWKWSSYSAYSKHEGATVPIEIDFRGYWSEAGLNKSETAGNARL